MNLIIYLPVLNEAMNLQAVLSTLPKHLDGVDNIEILVIDDGSKDDSAEIARVSSAQVISHDRNRGVGATFRSAVQYALVNQADILVGIDADGQFDPNEIADLIAPILQNKAEMVIGSRFSNGKPAYMSSVKYWGNRMVTNLINSITGEKFSDVSCGFRAYGREALFRLNVFGNFTYTHETILSMVYQGLRVFEKPVKVTYYPERKSRVARSITNYTLQTIKIILRILLDYRAMRILGTIGNILIGIGVLCEIGLFTYYAFAHRFTPYKVVGFIGLGFALFGMMIWLVALISDLLNRMRKNMDQQLYEIKKMRYSR
jgi:glycosyltransferase involved in cell wall biosynthesis